MATVNYSVPNELKERFNATFAGQNKSRIIARLMAQAVEEESRHVRREEAMDRLEARRASRSAVTRGEIDAARSAGRP